MIEDNQWYHMISNILRYMRFKPISLQLYHTIYVCMHTCIYIYIYIYIYVSAVLHAIPLQHDDTLTTLIHSIIQKHTKTIHRFVACCSVCWCILTTAHVETNICLSHGVQDFHWRGLIQWLNAIRIRQKSSKIIKHIQESDPVQLNEPGQLRQYGIG